MSSAAVCDIARWCDTICRNDTVAATAQIVNLITKHAYELNDLLEGLVHLLGTIVVLNINIDGVKLKEGVSAYEPLSFGMLSIHSI